MRTAGPLGTLLAVLGLASGCPHPDRAPEELEDLLLFAFAHYPTDDPTHDASLADAAENLEAWWEGLEGSDAEGFIYEAELAHPGSAELDALSPAPTYAEGGETVGVLVVREVDCTLTRTEDVYLDDNQLERFPEDYVAYQRSGQSDYGCYRNRSCPEAMWRAHIEKETAFLSVHYTFDVHSGVRYVNALPAGAALTAATKEALYSRAWLVDEAVVDPPELGRFRQSYTFEALIPQASSVLVFYALWTGLESDTLITDSAPFLAGYIDGTKAYLSQLESHCRD